MNDLEINKSLTELIADTIITGKTLENEVKRLDLENQDRRRRIDTEINRLLTANKSIETKKLLNELRSVVLQTGGDIETNIDLMRRNNRLNSRCVSNSLTEFN